MPGASRVGFNRGLVKFKRNSHLSLERLNLSLQAVCRKVTSHEQVGMLNHPVMHAGIVKIYDAVHDVSYSQSPPPMYFYPGRSCSK